jgi:AcrR family transcriptional regulator
MDNTKEKILQATERLIIEHGWEKVTFRMITSEAGVNLAAINYHFGSREALEDALLPRLIGPLDEKRSERLKEAQTKAAPKDLDMGVVIRCFLEPMLEFSLEYPNHHRMIQSFFSGIKDKNKIKEHFKGSIDLVNQQFVEALFKALPGVSKDKIRVQYVLLFASSHLLLNNEAFAGITESLGLSITIESFFEEMIRFYSAGFRMLEDKDRANDVV